MAPQPLVLPALIALVTCLAACTSTTTPGSGTHAPVTSSTTTTAPVSVPGTSAPGSPTPTTSAPSTTIHAAPAAPLRTKTVTSVTGTTYVIKIWADVTDATCADHAYGGPMIAFLDQNACRGLERLLLTTTVNGQGVGVAISTTSFRGTQPDPYKTTEAFRTLVEKDGTGNINDLLREGYRLPSGPTSVPSPDAFTVVGQDAGVSVYDIWYLDGPTPENDPPLLRMAQDIFLQY